MDRQHNEMTAPKLTEFIRNYAYNDDQIKEEEMGRILDT